MFVFEIRIPMLCLIEMAGEGIRKDEDMEMFCKKQNTEMQTVTCSFSNIFPPPRCSRFGEPTLRRQQIDDVDIGEEVMDERSIGLSKIIGIYAGFSILL